MRYQGGKSRIAKQIAMIITGAGGDDLTFVSLFCGSCSIESKVDGFARKILNDKHEYLIELLNGVKHGYDLPESISVDDYKYIKEHKDEDKVLAGFVGFGCSFGGKWFGGYASRLPHPHKQSHLPVFCCEQHHFFYQTLFFLSVVRKNGKTERRRSATVLISFAH